MIICLYEVHYVHIVNDTWKSATCDWYNLKIINLEKLEYLKKTIKMGNKIILFIKVH